MNITTKLGLALALVAGSFDANIWAQKNSGKSWTGVYSNGNITYNLFSDNSYFVKNGNYFQSGTFQKGSAANEIVLNPSGIVMKKQGSTLIQKGTNDAFAKDRSGAGYAADNAGVAIDSRLLGGKWVLTEIYGKAVTPSADRKEVFLAFKAEDASFYGNGGCNGFGGKVLANTEFKIEFGDAVQTMMACVGAMEIESQLHKALKATDNYSVKNGVLSLNKARMAPLAKFKFVKD
jgi:heat shock protein HslJ